jgi:hypothetical protein
MLSSNFLAGTGGRFTLCHGGHHEVPRIGDDLSGGMIGASTRLIHYPAGCIFLNYIRIFKKIVNKQINK